MSTPLVNSNSNHLILPSHAQMLHYARLPLGNDEEVEQEDDDDEDDDAIDVYEDPTFDLEYEVKPCYKTDKVKMIDIRW